MATLLLMAFAGGSDNAEGKTITVDDDGGADHTSIQAAVDAAEDGDTIRVFNGTYYEYVTVEKTLDIIGNGSADTTVDAQGAAGSFKITADRVNLTGFTLTGSGGGASSGGVRLYSDYCRIYGSNCSGNEGNGIYLTTSANYNVVDDNNCSNNNWGIYLTATSGSTDGYNTISNNSCFHNYHGIKLSRNNYNTISNNTCSNNPGENFGVGISLSESTNNVIQNNTLTGNEIGIFLSASSKNNIAHYNTITGNSDYGIDAVNNDGETIDARHNWWGDETGPYHPTGNPGGEGDNISDNADFEPWMRTPDGKPVAQIISILPNPAIANEIIEFRGQGSGKHGIVRFVWRGGIYGDVYNGSNSHFSTSVLSNNQTVFLKVEDEIGSWSEEVSMALVFHGKPGARILKLSPDPALDTDLIRFEAQGTDPDGDIIRYTWRSDIDGELYNGTGDKFMENLSRGIHTIYLKVQDEDGAWSDEVFDSIVVTGKPEIISFSISEEPLFKSESITFSCQAADDGSIERYVWYSNRNGEFNNNSEVFFSDSTLSPGTHTITVKVQDDLGFWSDIGQTVIVIHTKPMASIEYISKSSIEAGDSITFTGGGTDEDGVITCYSWRSSIDDYLYNGANDSFTLDNLSIGIHTIYLKVRDNDGYWGNEISTEIRVRDPSNISPSVSIASPANHTEISAIVTISGGASDDDGTVTKIEISMDDAAWQNATGTESWAFEWDTTAVADGEHHIRARAFDDSDYSTVVEILVDVKNTVVKNVKPTVTITSPIGGAGVSGEITIEGMAADTDGTVQKVEIRIGDGSWETATGTFSWVYDWDTTGTDNGSVEITVRAYDGTDYSDDYQITLSVKNDENPSGDNDHGDDDDSPAFGAALWITAAAIVAIRIGSRRSCEMTSHPRNHKPK